MSADRFAAALRGLVTEATEKTSQSVRDDMAAMEERLNKRIDGVRAELHALLAEPRKDVVEHAEGGAVARAKTGNPDSEGALTGMDHIPPPVMLEKPLLDALDELGGRAHRTDVERVVARNLRTPPALATMKHGGVSSGDDTELQYRLSWAGTALVKRGLIRKDGRGIWSLVGR